MLLLLSFASPADAQAAQAQDRTAFPFAVSTPKRTALLPDVPAIPEQFPRFGRDGAHAIMAPGGTPLAIRTKISSDVRQVLDQPDVKAKLEALAYNIEPSTPQEHDQIIREQIKAFAEIAKRVGLVEAGGS
jgi:tripartite-type tricarboxylate transporter receptor subunit TctC